MKKQLKKIPDIDQKYSISSDGYIVNTITKLEKAHIAKAMQMIADQRYSWKRITNCYAELFESSKPIEQRLIERVKSQEVKSVSVEVTSTQSAA